MTDNTVDRPNWYPWLVWGLGAAFFFAEYIARISPSVMVPDLMSAFSVGAYALGSLSAMFYYPYIVMQIPVGLLVDRFNVRWLIALMTLLTGVSCLIFGSATNIPVADIGRFLMGFASAFAFIGAMKLAALWFPPRRLGLLAGLTQALGMLGAAAGEAPVAYMVESIGWRASLWWMAVIFAVLALFIAWVVRNPHCQKAVAKADTSTVWQNLLIVLKNKQSWFNGLYAGLIFAPTGAFGELWGVTALTKTHGFDQHTAAAAVGMIFIGWGIGGPIIGWLSDHLGKRLPIMLGSALSGTAILCAVFYIPHLSATWTHLLLLLFGVSNTGVAIAYAVAAEINPEKVVGTSIAFANMASILIGALLQPVIGWLLDKFAKTHSAAAHITYTAQDFQQALIVLPICLLLGALCILGIRETHCKRKM